MRQSVLRKSQERRLHAKKLDLVEIERIDNLASSKAKSDENYLPIACELVRKAWELYSSELRSYISRNDSDLKYWEQLDREMAQKLDKMHEEYAWLRQTFGVAGPREMAQWLARKLFYNFEKHYDDFEKNWNDNPEDLIRAWLYKVRFNQDIHHFLKSVIGDDARVQEFDNMCSDAYLGHPIDDDDTSGGSDTNFHIDQERLSKQLNKLLRRIKSCN